MHVVMHFFHARLLREFNKVWVWVWVCSPLLANKDYQMGLKLKVALVTDSGRRQDRRATSTRCGSSRRHSDHSGHRSFGVDTRHRRRSRVSHCTYSCQHDCDTRTLSINRSIIIIIIIIIISRQCLWCCHHGTVIARVHVPAHLKNVERRQAAADPRSSQPT